MRLVGLVHRASSSRAALWAEVMVSCASVLALALIVSAHLAAVASVPSAADESADATATALTFAVVTAAAVVSATVRAVHDARRPVLLALISLGADPVAVTVACALRSVLLAAGGALIAGVLMIPIVVSSGLDTSVRLLDRAAQTVQPPVGQSATTVAMASLAVMSMFCLSAFAAAIPSRRRLPAAALRETSRRAFPSSAFRVAASLVVLVSVIGPVVALALLSPALPRLVRALSPALSPEELRGVERLVEMSEGSWAMAFMVASTLAVVVTLAMLAPVVGVALVRAAAALAPLRGVVWYLARRIAVERVAVTSASASATVILVGLVALTQATFDLAAMTGFELQTTVPEQWLEVAWSLGPAVVIALSGGVAAMLVASRQDSSDWIALAGMGLSRRSARLVPLAQASLQTCAAGVPPVALALLALGAALGLAEVTGSMVVVSAPDLRPAAAAVLVCLVVDVSVSIRRLPDALGRGGRAGGRLLL